jgi:hypothetical protein
MRSPALAGLVLAVLVQAPLAGQYDTLPGTGSISNQAPKRDIGLMGNTPTGKSVSGPECSTARART